jgi:hypothetical protein
VSVVVAEAIICPPGFAAFWTVVYAIWPVRIIRGEFFRRWMWAAGSMGAVFAVQQMWLPAAIGAGSLVLAALIRWRRRKKRRKAAALLRAKSKALRDGLVRRLRDAAPRTGPKLRPSPVPG